jgi:hypothetical protein
MIGLKRRTVVEWFRVQSKWKVMYNGNVGLFQLRDMVNNISVGAFNEHDDAVEFAFDLVHDNV